MSLSLCITSLLLFGDKNGTFSDDDDDDGDDNDADRPTLSVSAWRVA